MPTATATGTPRAVPDTTPPSCLLTAIGTNSHGQKYLQVTVQDSGSGLRSLTLTTLVNVIADIPPYASGVDAASTTIATRDYPTSRIVVTATRQDQTKGAQLALQVTDVAGNAVSCDPVLAELSHGSRTQVFKDVPQAESNITLHNGNPGLRQVRAIVNGRTFVISNLRPRESRTLDVASAMLPGSHNTIVLRALGPAGANADVIIWDGHGLLPGPAGLVAPPRVHVTHLEHRAGAPSSHEDELVNWSGGSDSADDP